MYHAKKRWVYPETDATAIEQLQTELNISEQLATLLTQRGHREPDAAKAFLQIEDELEFHDPNLFEQMPKVVERLKRAADEGEMVLIYGDYDVDGVSASAVMWHALTEIGVMAECYIPNRFTEGYGPNKEAFSWAASEGFTLVITVDCGISGIEEAALLKELNVDLIITDHHEPKATLPDAFAIIHPHIDPSYPYDKLAGAGVALKVAHAVLGRMPDELLDLAVLGTIADLVPLDGENRLLAKLGLKALDESKRPGILALREVCALTDSTLNEESVGFAFGPRINAAGRLDSAMPALQMLLAESVEEALVLANQLDKQNKERQDIVKTIAKEATELVEASMTDDRVLVVASERWNPGVVGIVASRLVEAYYRPVILLCHDPKTGKAKGSGRSIDGFDLFKELSKNEDILPHFGGHPAAAGMTLMSENVAELRRRLNEQAESIPDETFVARVNVDLKLDVSDVSLDLIAEIGKLAPFGMGNPSPRVVVADAKLRDIRQIGRDNTHLKVQLAGDKRELDGIGFGFGHVVSEISKMAHISVMGSLQVNEWNGMRKPQLMIQDIRVDGFQVFDYRGKKNSIDELRQLPSDATSYVSFRGESNEFSLHDFKTPVKRFVVLLDLPDDETALSDLLNEDVERVYCAFGQAGNSFFEKLPSREDFRTYYVHMATCERKHLRENLIRLSIERKWTKNTIQFMHQVFSELEFLVTMEDGLPGVNPEAPKRDLTEAPCYKRRVGREQLEERFVYASLAELKERLQSLRSNKMQEAYT
ncbi:single-stranded-DNA-specific exonuclease RecJ [Exiguobacterium sp. SH5S13]|uniref:single-stranded-DNA-specific exonuclease RecJ n=1 Tax=unclassified Exiguobacterium TaxID=2644629 RepID=UPI00103D9E03|nr:MULTISPECIES: single-stranded-DNA-specific exonuclease RecJ [unclassified Exiguobacterium]TCI26584.1 single-stranded-DNA-specific exonuclease RecJ [Exiguobacterium sp. SH5S4]TCI53507.1 single-stranded-DNA-specific exonuclease RecJ [Exiguobacterium sp. SH5S13]